MSANNPSGGVRNLRAMFENKASEHSTSPPSRGRSPNGSDISGHSRPVSKVRTSFVAVERPGEAGQPPQLGLRKASDVSHLAEGKRYNAGARSTSDRNMEPMPPSPHTSLDAMDGGLGTILKGSAFESGNPAEKETQTNRLAQALNASKAQNKLPAAPKANGDNSKAAAMVKKMQPTEDKSQVAPATKLKVTTGAQPVKPLPTRQMHSKPSPLSPALAKQNPETPTSPNPSKQNSKVASPPPVAAMRNIRGGPAKIKAVMESAGKAREARESLAKNSEPEAVPKVSEPQPKPKTNGSKKENTTSPTTIKPPRSPSKPHRLPSAATATTASSAAKTDSHPVHEQEFRKSVPKRPSILPMKQPKVATNGTASTLAKKASRASLANSQERPKSRVSTSKPDESFLSRMTRPTASSAQKTHEKVQTNSPPRSRNASGNKHGSGKLKPPRMSLRGQEKREGHENKDDEEGDGIKHPQAENTALPDKIEENSSTSAITNEGSLPPPQAGT